MRLEVCTLVLLTLLAVTTISTPSDVLDNSLQSIRLDRSLMGLQLELTKNQKTIYHGNFGLKDGKSPIQTNTMFRIASLSKSFVSAGIMLLVQDKKVQLTDSIGKILGFQIKNPHFPASQITIEMILSHQSGLIQCDPYYSNFLMDTYNAKTGSDVPHLKQILAVGGKYYNQCLFSSTNSPGTHFQYVNLNFGIGGAIIQTLSGLRFDVYMHDKILRYLSTDLPQQATFNAATIKNSSLLGTIFVGSKGEWSSSYDSYPNGVIPQRNLDGYKIGSNGVVFGPQGGLRATVTHLSNYMIMLSKNGITKQGIKILSKESVEQMLKPRYQFHGTGFGASNDFHLYGLGLYTTTYRKNDFVLSHRVLRGHLGSAYGLISGYYFWQNYTLTYQINGALNGYGYGTGTIYEKERLLIHSAIETFLTNNNYIEAMI